MAVDGRKEPFYKVVIRGQEFLFTDMRVIRSSVPKNLFMYEVRESDDGGEPCEISEGIMVNFYGTLISKTPITNWDEDNGKGRHFIYLKFSDIPEFYDGPDGITDEKTADSFPHFAPLISEWDIDYEDSISLEEYLEAA